MEIDAILKKYKKRLVVEAVIKSVLLALVIGFAVNFLYAVADWMIGLKMPYVGFAVGGAVALVSGILLYFLKYRPSEKQIAQRLDALGLLERIVTMNELKNDDSYIAKRQREDAALAVSKVSTTMLKVAVSSALVVALAVTLVFSTGFTVAAQTSDKSGVQLIDEMINGEKIRFCTLSYDVDGEGRIEGDQFQEVEKESDGTPVTAIAEDGWMFVGWSDDYTEPTRQDLAVTEDIEVFAIFMEAEESDEAQEDEEGEGDGEDGEDDGASDHPQEGQPGEGDGQDGAPGDDGEQEGQPSDQSLADGDPMDGAGGGRSSPSNQIIDGQSYYGDYYGDAVTDASGSGREGSDIANAYIHGLQSGGGN